MKYLLNSLSPSMFMCPCKIKLFKIGFDEFDDTLHKWFGKIDFKSAIDNKATAKIVAALTKLPVEVNKETVKVEDSDEVLIIEINLELPKNKVYTFDELIRMHERGDIVFYKLTVKELYKRT